MLLKLASAKLEAKNPQVWSMFQNMEFSIDAMLVLLPMVEIDQQDPAEVAATWVANNEGIWSHWFN